MPNQRNRKKTTVHTKLVTPALHARCAQAGTVAAIDGSWRGRRVGLNGRNVGIAHAEDCVERDLDLVDDLQAPNSVE